MQCYPPFSFAKSFFAISDIAGKQYHYSEGTVNPGSHFYWHNGTQTRHKHLAAIECGLHVLVTKPPVKTLEDHLALLEASRRKGVLVMVEVHKRFDPIYVDARDRIRNLGGFGYMNAYMSQPKHQLDTFKAWAGKSSDISYYLNSHHIDFHEWSNQGIARPNRVVGTVHVDDMHAIQKRHIVVPWL